ncbi:MULTISPECIES: hypothetical protein [Agarivorans]|uniref:hypothetical protein n=1 Tax=Agarivorans TaxID=261825 RepID=UPI0010F93D60|nr:MULTISPECIES: hypothetical protein [Agarivorans]UPW18687.1 hypothetical protein M0C34_21135 [Agarivorans sp. TSD2052]
MKNVLTFAAFTTTLVLTGCGETKLSPKGEAAMSYMANYVYLKNNCEVDSMADLGMAMGMAMMAPIVSAELNGDKDASDSLLKERSARVTGSCKEVDQAISDAGKAFKAASQ